jgi:hypothetical protein
VKVREGCGERRVKKKNNNNNNSSRASGRQFGSKRLCKISQRGRRGTTKKERVGVVGVVEEGRRHQEDERLREYLTKQQTPYTRISKVYVFLLSKCRPARAIWRKSEKSEKLRAASVCFSCITIISADFHKDKG